MKKRTKTGWVLHDMLKTREYNSWTNMKYRCYNQNNPSYKRYGGRGIKVCDRWLGRYGFVNFYADMGDRPSDTSLDRIDNDGDYTPENCRWATRAEQQNNHGRCRILEYHGERLNVTQWSRRLGINQNTLTKRVNNGWSVGEALNFVSRQKSKIK